MESFTKNFRFGGFFSQEKACRQGGSPHSGNPAISSSGSVNERSFAVLDFPRSVREKRSRKDSHVSGELSSGLVAGAEVNQHRIPALQCRGRSLRSENFQSIGKTKSLAIRP